MGDLSRRVQFQLLLLNISKALKTTEEAELDLIIQSSLQKIVIFDNDDFCSINLISDDEKTIIRTFEWFSETHLKLYAPSSRISTEQLAWSMDQLTGEIPVTVFDLSKTANMPFSEKEFYRQQGIQSLLLIPMTDGKQLIGIIEIASVNKIKIWDVETIGMFDFLAQIFAKELKQKNIINDLRTSENNYRAIFNSMVNAKLIVDSESTIVSCNTEFEVMSGYRKQEIEGKKWADFVSDEVIQEVNAFRDQQLIDPNQTKFDFTFFNKQGKSRVISLSAAPIPQTTRTVIELYDITSYTRIKRAMESIVACDKIINQATTEKELIEGVLQKIVEIGGYRFTWLGFLKQGKVLTIQPFAFAGYEDGYLDHLGIKLTDPNRSGGPTGTAINTGTVAICKNFAEDPSVAAWREEALKRGYHSSIALPLKRAESGIIGIMNIYSSEEDAFDEEEVQLLSEMVSGLTFGIISLRMQDQRNQSAEDLLYSLSKMQRVLSQIVLSLSMVVEIRDPYTAGHQRRVATLSIALAKQLNYTEDQLQEISIAASIHDIGKISVPNEILNRPGKLNEMEMGIIKMHSQSGYEITKGIEFAWPIADIILQHHERYDGSGYPNGLKGEEILMSARIIAVADTVEAMNSHRPYRPAVGLEKALAEIVNQRGIHYDPQVVDACVDLFNNLGFSWELKDQ